MIHPSRGKYGEYVCTHVTCTLYPLSTQPQARMLPPQTRVHHYALKGKASSFQMLKETSVKLSPRNHLIIRQAESQARKAARLTRCHLKKCHLEWEGTHHSSWRNSLYFIVLNQGQLYLLRPCLETRWTVMSTGERATDIKWPERSHLSEGRNSRRYLYANTAETNAHQKCPQPETIHP